MASKKSQKYWEEREAESLKHYITEEEEFKKEIDKIYRDMLDSVQNEIYSFYGRYATKEGISMAEAKKRVSQADIKALERKAKQYVKDAAKDRRANFGKTNTEGYYFSDEANEEMRLYNLTMKVNRLEMLKANIGLELIDGHSKLEKFMGDILQGRTEAELKRQAGILGKTIQNNAQAARVIVNASFHNATFSQRIWMYNDAMKADLSRMISTALIQGKNPRVFAKELEKYYIGEEKLKNGKKGAKYRAESLLITELARVQTESQKESYIRNGFEEYTFHANSGCCDICDVLNGKHFKVKDMMPGKNAPPMHPRCRCSTSAYEDSADYEAWLDYLDKGGTTEEWNLLKKAKLAMQNGSIWPAKREKITNAEYKDIMKYAREKEIELSKFKNFDGDPETIYELIDDADSVAVKYPNIKKGKRKLTIRLDENMSADDFAETYGHIIHINSNAFRDKSKLAEEYDKAVRSKWFVSGTDYHSIIKHEIGHVVADKYKIDGLSVAQKVLGTKNNAEIMEYLFENMSQYSALHDDGTEIISECFANVFGSKKPLNFALQFLEECDKIIKQGE